MLKNFMQQLSSPTIKTLGLGASLICVASLNTVAIAAPAKANADNRVEFKSSLPITQEEIAAVDVLGEICPKIIGKNTNFDKGFERLLTDLLPNIEQPVLSLKALKDDADYQKILAEARSDANRATVQENREVCLEIVNYPAANKAGTKAAKK